MHSGATPEGSIITGVVDTVHGYVLNHGTFTRFDVPGSILTFPYDMNPQGEIVGNYRDSSRMLLHAFFRDQDGVLTTLDVDSPGSTNTQARSINAPGEIVGWYNKGGTNHGFIARPALSVAFDTTRVRPGGSFNANFSDDNLTSTTYFDLRFRAPGAGSDEEVGIGNKACPQAISWRKARRWETGRSRFSGALFDTSIGGLPAITFPRNTLCTAAATIRMPVTFPVMTLSSIKLSVAPARRTLGYWVEV